MLPFLKPKAVGGLITSIRKPDGGQQEHHEEGNENHALEACADDMLRAIKSGDSKAYAAALKAAFDVLESNESDEQEENE